MKDDIQVVPEVKIPDLTPNKRLKEDIVKSNLEIIVLSRLSEKPMCGQDLIKEIFSKYNVFLSQGTIYPLLYSLKEEGILRAEFTKGDMRTKRYVLTEQGKQIIEKRINEYIEVNNFILDSIKNKGSQVKKGEPYV